MGSKFDVDVTDSIGWSLLHIAVGLADLGEPIVMWLVGRDADVNMKNNAGQTPLHIAASKAYLANIRYLLEHGAKAAVKDSRQMATPLHRAAAVGSLPAVRLLLEHKCPVNATDRDGLTALHHGEFFVIIRKWSLTAHSNCGGPRRCCTGIAEEGSGSHEEGWRGKIGNRSGSRWKGTWNVIIVQWRLY